MEKYYIEPEVAGEIGDKSEMDTSIYPPKINKLDYSFSGWLGDDILECYPCFIVSERLANALKKENIEGITFDDITVSKSDEFIELYPDRKLPGFYWMKFSNNEDIFLSEDQRLVISENIMKIFEKFNISNAIIEKYI